MSQQISTAVWTADQPKPNQLSGLTIYSLVGCQFSEKATTLAASMGEGQIYTISAESKDDFKRWVKPYLRGIQHETFPVVFLDDILLGGYHDFLKFVYPSI